MILAQHFFLWPDQLPPEACNDALLESARLLRLQQFQAAEAMLLIQYRAQPASCDVLGMLALLRLRQVLLPAYLALVDELQAIDPENPGLRFLQAQYWLQIGEIPQLLALPQEFWEPAQGFWPLQLAKAALSIHLNKLPQALAALEAIPAPWGDCLEAIRLHCRILEREQKYQQALQLLLAAAQRFPQHWPAQVHLVDLTIKARSHDHALPCLRQALAQHGAAPELLPQIAQIQLLRNRVADARRTALQDQLWNTVRRVSSVASTNLLNCYDRLGYAEWLAFKSTQARDQSISVSLEMQENLCMQAASLELPTVPTAVADVVEHYSRHPDFLPAVAKAPGLVSSRQPGTKRPLTVAWITADLAYHPVSRFLLGFFAASPQLEHRHLLVDTCDHLVESNRCQFEGLTNLQVHNIGHGEWPAKLAAIRALQADVAIDLSGWTGGHFMRGFLARLAPVQMSYLGYFASTGLPTMDVWLGDDQLFPTPMQEWHTESIHRLQRCFIAWQPPAQLPEATVDVAEARPAGGIRFGSFNHNRKLSDATLRLWGDLLGSLPGSSLVLKASHRDDAATQELLCRRMRRQGLDPERVIWLPRADGPLEHLRQYGLVDVALDCFPNGGCTTTCEALWMGTPVITLTGRSYVSRMSTAVLHGAAMGEWCASSPEHYLQLARAQADGLVWLRQNRSHWRHQLQVNPLGDAADLMDQLELAFTTLVAAKR